MKILQVMAGGRHGGAETAFVDMCLALHEAGQSIEVATRPNPDRVPPLKHAGIPVHTLPFGGAPDLYTPFRLRQIIKAFQPHIVQTWMARGTHKTPAWHAGMGIPRYLVNARLGGYYKLKYFKSSQYFTTITPDIRGYLMKNGIAGDHVRHINNFAETEQADTPVDRASLHTPADAPLLLALGRLHEAKAFDTLIKAVARTSGVHLWIAGEGPDRAALTALINTLNVEDRVKLLGWRTDRAALFQACDLCVFPSRYEPFGTVFVQAWAHETPLIAAKAAGPAQFVRDGEDGLMVEIDDVPGLARAIETLAADQDLQKRLVQNGLQRYRGEFTKKAAVTGYLSWYDAIRAKEGL